MVRLSVNLNRETANALRGLAEQNGITHTEAVRRAISILKFINDEKQYGRKIHVMDQDGRNVQELVLL